MIRNPLIDEQCAKIRKDRADITCEELKSALDTFVSILNQINADNERDAAIEQIVSALASLPHRHEKLARPELIQHQLVMILRDIAIVNYLQRRNNENTETSKVLSETSVIFMNLCSNINDSISSTLKALLFHQPWIDEMARCLSEMSQQGHHFNDYSLLRAIRHFLMTFKNYLRNETVTDEYTLLAPIRVKVMECLCSSYAIEIVKALKPNFNQRLSEAQIVFLDTFAFYLLWYPDPPESDYEIPKLRNLLKQFTLWIRSCPAQSYLDCSSHVGNMTRHLCYFLVRPILSENVNVFSEIFYEDYCQLVLFWSSILPSVLTCQIDKMRLHPVRTVIQNLYNFTLHSSVVNFMKTIPDFIAMLLKITDINHDEIQLNAYRCLGKLMMEQDIKTMANPEKIAKVHIEFISQTINDGKKSERFLSLLESLKNFVQHDQVKLELIKQDAIPLLIRCLLEHRYDRIKIQQMSLEILMALSFDESTSLVLRQNQPLINHVRSLLNAGDADQLDLKRAAEGLLWKLEKDDDVSIPSTPLRSSTYDLMISYSHRDKQFCLRIHQQLVNDGYRVWIDKDCLRGSTMIGIANAIENSDNVLICMSTTYKQSVYCQSEAHYAFERGRRLIPIIIEEDYKPDGWLGIIVSGKIYVNFAKEEFSLAYEQLKNEISQQPFRSLCHSTETVDQIELHPNESSVESVIDLPESISQWTHDHVRSFLLRMGLGKTMIPLCTLLDGDRLLQLYEMCQSNRESMYQSLKFELNEKYRILLPIADYLTFLHEIKRYIPATSTQRPPSPSSSFSVTICNLV